jgi:hypothetical protein
MEKEREEKKPAERKRLAARWRGRQVWFASGGDGEGRGGDIEGRDPYRD